MPKISQLPSGIPTPTDIFPFVQGGVTKQGSISSILNSNYLELTYTQANTLVSTSGLTKGASYKITDRGDNGILLQAADVDQFSPNGVRFMLCPNYSITGNVKGIWNGLSATTVFNPSDRVIWGGYYWDNVSGGTGSATNVITLNSDWTVVPKTLSNGYEEKLFTIKYDFTNDWIEQQSDDFGNIVGVSYDTASTFYLFNPCDHTDWNITSYSGITLFSNNVVMSGLYNNCNQDGTPITVFNNKVIFPDVSGGQALGISNNIFSGTGEIIGNISEIIASNILDTAIGNNKSSVIGDNLINGNIYDNQSMNFGNGIVGNTNNGDIANNYSQTIFNNSNNGDIFSNTILGAIDNNSNLGDISENNLYSIQNVTVSGDCVGNKGGGKLDFMQSFNGDANGNVIETNYGKTHYEFVFSATPLVVGAAQFFQSLPLGSNVKAFYGVGNSLSSTTNTATIKIGPAVDDPTIISNSISTLNSYTSDVNLLSTPSVTTTANRLFQISAIGEDVTGGTLNVWIEYVTQ